MNNPLGKIGRWGIRLAVSLTAFILTVTVSNAQTVSDAGLGWPYSYCVDLVKAEPGYLHIKGWAYPNSKSSQIKLIFSSSDGDKFVDLFKRQDVINAFSLPSWMNTGYDVYLPFTAGSYSGQQIICHAYDGSTPYRIFYVSATITKPTATFDKQGGTGGTSSASVDFNKANPTITIPEKARYRFLGYYTGKNGTGKQYYDSDGKSVAVWKEVGGKTLYAQWELKASVDSSKKAEGTKIEIKGHVNGEDVIDAMERQTDKGRLSVVDMSVADDVTNPTEIIDLVRSNPKSTANTLVYLPKLKIGQSVPIDKSENVIVKQSDNSLKSTNYSVSDGIPLSVPHPFSADAATYNRTQSSRWGTVCVPYALKSDSRIQFYTSGSIVGSELILEKADIVPAGQGAIYQAKYIDISGEGGSTSVKKDFSKTDVARAVVTAPASSAAYVKVQGQFTELVIDDAKAGDFSGYDLYYYKDNKFYKRTEGQTVTIPALRAYILIPKAEPSSKSLELRLSGL